MKELFLDLNLKKIPFLSRYKITMSSYKYRTLWDKDHLDRGHPLMMSEFRGREGVHEIRTLLIKGQ